MLFNFIYKPRFFVLFIVRTITQTWSDIYTLKINEQFTRSKVTKSAICNFPRAPLARFFVFFIEETITQTWSDIYTWKKKQAIRSKKSYRVGHMQFSARWRRAGNEQFSLLRRLVSLRNEKWHFAHSSRHIRAHKLECGTFVSWAISRPLL